MAQKRNGVKKNKKDPRTKIIQSIWGITAGLFGISIPLTALTNGDALVLPVLAILGATVSSCVVWMTRAPKQEPNRELERTVAELRHRVAQLEIDSRDMELRYSIQQSSGAQQAAQAPQPNSPQQ